MTNAEWISIYESSIQTISAIVMAFLTWRYLVATKRLAAISESQAEILKRRSENDKPRVTFYCEAGSASATKVISFF